MATTTRKPRTHSENQPSKVTSSTTPVFTEEKQDIHDIEASFDVIKMVEKEDLAFQELNYDEGKTIKEYELCKRNGLVTFLRQDGVRVVDGNNGLRHLRYAPNEKSVWADEQNNALVQREPIKFKEGKLIVPVGYKQLITFLDKHPDNEKNGGGTFREVNKVKKAKETLETKHKAYDAIAVVRTKSLSELMPLVYRFNINQRQSNEDIMLELWRIAETQPEAFMKAMEDPIVKLQAVVKQALAFNIISVENDRIVWTDSGNMIVTVIAGKTPEYTLARFLSSERGIPTYEELMSQLKQAKS